MIKILFINSCVFRNPVTKYRLVAGLDKSCLVDLEKLESVGVQSYPQVKIILCLAKFCPLTLIRGIHKGLLCAPNRPLLSSFNAR